MSIEEILIKPELEHDDIIMLLQCENEDKTKLFEKELKLKKTL